MLKHPVVSVAVGGTVLAIDGLQAVYGAVGRLPVVGSWMRRGVATLSERGDRWITQNMDAIQARLVPTAVGWVELVLDEIDLTALIDERLDLIVLADKVINGVDLPAIIRESTNSVTAEVMTDVRSQGERADDLVAGIVDRVLGRDRNQP